MQHFDFSRFLDAIQFQQLFPGTMDAFSMIYGADSTHYGQSTHFDYLALVLIYMLIQQINNQLVLMQYHFFAHALRDSVKLVDRFSIVQNRKAILLFGNTKCGKSTLCYHLNGKKLIRIKNEDLQIMQMEAQNVEDDVIIGNHLEVQTIYPNLFRNAAQNELSIIIDLPAFEDYRNENKLLNIEILRQIVKKVASVHIVLVISEEDINESSMLHIFNQHSAILSEEYLNAEKCFSIVITKVEDDNLAETCIEAVNNLKAEAENAKTLKLLNKFMMQNIYFFKNEDPSIEEGLKMRESIQKDGFYEIQLPNNTILSQNFQNYIIGEDNMNQFINIISQNLQKFAGAVKEILQISNMFFKAYYFQIYADKKSELTKQNFIQALKSTERTNIEIKQIQKSIQSLNEHITISDSIIVDFIMQFQKIEMKNIEDMQPFLDKISETIARIDKPKEIYALVSSLSSIIGALCTLPIKDSLNSIYAIVKQFYDSFYSLPTKENLFQKIKSIKSIAKRIEHDQVLKEIVEFYEDQNEDQAQFDQKEGRNYLEYKKQKMFRQVINNAKLTIKESQTSLSNTAAHNLQILSNQNASDNQKEESLNSIINILWRSSLFEESIAFCMVSTDTYRLEQIVNQGFQLSILSEEFVKQILIPFFEFDYPTEHMLVCCYDYLNLNFCDDKAKILSNQEELFEKRKNFKQSKIYEISMDIVSHFLERDGMTILTNQIKQKERMLSQWKPWNIIDQYVKL